MIVFLFPIAIAVCLGLIVGYSWKYGISPTPSSPKVKQELCSLLPTIPSGEIVELGSGWGTLAFALAKQFPHCQVNAWEISPIPYLYSWMISKVLAYPNLSIKRGDFFHISLHSAVLVVCYLYPGAMARLKRKFEDELTPEAYVASHTFALPGWKPLMIKRINDIYHTPIYLYQLKYISSGYQQVDDQDFV